MTVDEFNNLVRSICTKTKGEVTLSPTGRTGLWVAMVPENVVTNYIKNSPPSFDCNRYVKGTGVSPSDAVVNLAKEIKVI